MGSPSRDLTSPCWYEAGLRVMCLTPSSIGALQILESVGIDGEDASQLRDLAKLVRLFVWSGLTIDSTCMRHSAKRDDFHQSP